jgi:hypothetical protein
MKIYKVFGIAGELDEGAGARWRYSRGVHETPSI